MKKTSSLLNKVNMTEKFCFRKNTTPDMAFTWAIFVFVIASVLFIFLSCEAWCADVEAVAMPSRFAGASGKTGTDVTNNGLESMRVIEAPRTPVSPPNSDAANMNKSYFMFGGKPPQIVCQVGMITDIELEPGERVENYSVTDGDRWSVSAAWSGHVNNLVTHVLLRTFFPDVKSKMAIYTNRRVYEMELVSGLNVAHMANVGFRYPGVITEDEPEEIPPGKYRDLLVKYKIIEDPQAEEKAAKRIDGADLNFRYEIKHIGNKKPQWIPKSVYDADGRTFIVLPRGAVGQGEGKITLSPSLFIVDKGARFIAKISPVKEDVFVVDRLFDEAIIAANGIEVSIRRKFSID